MSPDGPRHGGLRAERLVLKAGARAIDEHLFPGDIVGVAGLDGHGQEAFLETLAGLRLPAGGKVTVASGTGRTVITSFKHAVRERIAYLARDRRTHGIFPALSILDNFAMASIDRDVRGGLIDGARLRARFAEWQTRLEIVAADPAAPITSLSGGNQQKVLLARWLALAPRVLLLNDPTRGVDQRTREILYRTFVDLARSEGLAIMLLSTEIEEVLRLCDRVLVFRDGEVSARLQAEGMTHGAVIEAMFGRSA